MLFQIAIQIFVATARLRTAAIQNHSTRMGLRKPMALTENRYLLQIRLARVLRKHIKPNLHRLAMLLLNRWKCRITIRVLLCHAKSITTRPRQQPQPVSPPVTY